MCREILLYDGALLISDAHYSREYRPQLKQLLIDIQDKKIIAKQIVFMGDIFDTLFGGITRTIMQNKDIIDIIDDISQTIEIIYLEGNHDFCLKKIFKNVKVFSIKSQPVACKYKDKKVLLAHGDFSEGFVYNIYTSFIRNGIILLFLKYIDIIGKHFLLKKLDGYLKQKDDCQKFANFKDYVRERLQKEYLNRCDIFIEGHFHQDIKYTFNKTLYINLPAFACNQRYFIVTSHLTER